MIDAVAKWAEGKRRELGLTQADIGKLLNVSQPQARSRLRGEIEFSLSEIAKLERRFQTKAPIASDLPTMIQGRMKVDTTEFRMVPEYDVHVSAGGGALVSDENIAGQWPFNPDFITGYLGIRNRGLAIVEVRGDSMEPTLHTGDKIMINMADKEVSQGGLFVLFDGDGTVIKRVDKIFGEDRVRLISDNPRHQEYEADIERVQVVGRVIWFGRRL